MNSKPLLTLCCALFPLSLTTAEADLIWHSPLDGDANTLIGAAGTPTGSPIETADANGNPDGAVLFDGASFFDIGTLGPFNAGTISAWVRSDDNSTERGAVAAGATGGGASVYFSFMNQNAGEIRVDLDDGAARRDAQGGGAQVIGQWYHIATTFAEGGTLRLYIDGVEVNTQGLGGNNAPYVMSNSGLIGTERTGSRFWIGAIDDVRIYNSELTPAEVTTLFNNGPLYNNDDTDSDGDGMADSFEQLIIDADPDDAINTLADVLPGDDFDNDGSNNEDEEANSTNPVDDDTDNDGYLDGVETGDGTFDDIATDTGTDPRDADTDDDGLPDGVETNDGTFDDIATDTGTNPLVADTDDDMIPDGFEAANMLDPLVDDAGLDADDDLSNNLNEFQVGTDPNEPDSDGDGYEDGVETDDGTFDDIASDTGTDPLDPDSDGDGLLDGAETNDGTFDDALTDTGSSPLLEDSDSDNFRDGAEVNLHGTDPNVAGSAPQGLDVLFLGGNAAGNQGSDDEAIRFIQDKYGITNVVYLQASASDESSEDSFDLLVISSTPGSGDMRDKFEDSLVPIVNWEEALSDNGAGEFGMASALMTKSVTTTEIAMTGHPIGSGLPETVVLFDNPGPETTSTANLFPGLTSAGNAANGTASADGADVTGFAMILLAEAGDAVDPGALVPGDAAPARRVMLPFTDNTIASLTADGLTLFGNAMDWAVGRIGGAEPLRVTSIAYDDTSDPGNIIVTLTFTSELNRTYSVFTSTDLPVGANTDVDDSVEGDDGTTEFIIDFDAYGIDKSSPRRFFEVLENQDN